MPEIEFCFKCEENFFENISDVLNSYHQKEQLSTALYSYYLGIMYYRYIVKNKNLRRNKSC